MSMALEDELSPLWLVAAIALSICIIAGLISSCKQKNKEREIHQKPTNNKESL